MDHAHRRRGIGRRKQSERKTNGECRREERRECAGERENKRKGIARRKEIAGESLQGSDHRAERASGPAVNLDVGSVGACE